ncbi:alkaline-phosphatase-like protein [Aspergillus caelatus]|uniref:Alkaline-phosphatase-like protein n=1 Tax=Aspergillus caelatus TaxID=61420 RepID=A0A5N6ZUZ3_9EURO|nr:alkaline-phosphatase-like protein [Aspergillus caelatus]KAE8360746.1 alkaline-phosphatase-like protein [Aspergillus caelatus]
MPSKKPNLVIFMPDQLRYDSLSCTSTPKTTFLKTPNISSFASRGTIFTNCFTQASVCSQSRCSMFTGTYPHVSGHRSLENLIKPWEPNLFRSLKENGYHVACLAPRGDTFAPTVTELSVDEYGFLETPEFVPRFSGDKANDSKDESIWGRLFYKGLRNAAEASDYDDAVVRSALRWLECPPQDKPWVLFMPLIFPHCPFQVEEPYFSLYDRDIIPEPGAAPGEKTGYEPRYMQVIRERYGTGRATGEIWQELKATYYGMISRLDDQFGRVVGRLDELGLWDDTITMFFTDHGEYLGDHGLIEKWPSGLSDSLVHEPLIIAGRGLPQGQVYTGMAEMVDLVPTVLELCGIPEQFPHNGRSLVPVLRDPSLGHKEYAFSEGGFLTAEEPLLEQAPYPYDIKAALQHEDTTLVGKAVSIRSLEWTFVYRLYEPAELYHRQRDPEEMHNLAAEPKYVPVARMLEAEVLRWLFESSDFLPWTKDTRFPEVKLKSPKEQLEERLRMRYPGESN